MVWGRAAVVAAWVALALAVGVGDRAAAQGVPVPDPAGASGATGPGVTGLTGPTGPTTGPTGSTGVALASPFLVADTVHPGRIDLAFFGANDLTVRFAEVEPGGQRRPLGEAVGVGPLGFAGLAEAATWRCDRLVRSFEADAVDAMTPAHGTFAIRTPSCRDRFALAAPEHVAPRARVPVSVVDRWALGDTPVLLCLGVRRLSCQRLTPTAKPKVRHVQASRSGRVLVELRAAGTTTRRTVAVGGKPVAVPSRPLVLTAGDSSAQTLDAFLAERLGQRALVVPKVVPGSALSQPGNPDWPTMAAAQARTLRPQLTVVSIGANEGFPMTTPTGSRVECCDAAWVAELARRQRTLMVSYARGGQAKVLWLTLPVPRDPRRQPITAAVNEGAAQAAVGLPEVTLVHLDQVLSPGGQYADTITYQGAQIDVREPDGIHLSPDGTRIAADVITRVIRAVGLPRPT